MSRRPPKNVPTLTEVVQSAGTVPSPVAASVEPEPLLTQEQLVQRVMQRVELTLDRRLREAIGAVVLAHTRELGPLIRERLEAVVRDAVAQAIAEEKQTPQPTKPRPS